ncbi:MAG: exodeoxyribonuclease VII large subunit [Rhodothermales bacterium]
MYPDSDPGQILSVGALTASVRQLLEDHFSRIWVEGEVSNFKRHSSGHLYFTLKDSSAQIRCVMFRSDARSLRFEPADGMLVQAGGQVSVYEARGEYQLLTRRMRPAGEGAMRKAFEAVKRKLAEEGLFDVARKIAIPAVPSSIGLVTSSDGAALRDILTVLKRRYAGVRVVLRPTAVQGIGAAAEIAAAIRLFNRHAALHTDQQVDVMIVGRGGGSEEDLWCFNEEIVARAIAASRIPIISAVGHETDVSIADLAADLRAPTPSAAAEAAVPDGQEIIYRIDQQKQRIERMLRRMIADRRGTIRRITSSRGFHQPEVRLQMLSQRLDELTSRSRLSMNHRLQNLQTAAAALQSRITSLDPRLPLDRGFALVERDGQPVKRSADLEAGDAVGLVFRDGRRSARVTD